MSDDEVIKFEITDYDLDNEFRINRGRKQTREHQIYGVWAKDSDEEDNEDVVRQKVRKPKDFSAPIGFVAGGVQQAGKKKKEENKELQAGEPSNSQLIHTSLQSDSSDDERPQTPDARETAGIRRVGQGMKAPNLGGNVGAWERHTKGIGAKLLLQMGYKPGKGLGKDLQGISAPVEATLRKGRGAIGAYGPEKSTQKAKKEAEKKLKDKEEDKDDAPKSYHWKKSHKGRYFYRDAADVIQEGKPALHTMTTSSLAQVPVIDMTGREKRVLSGYGAIRAAAPRYEHEARRECRHFAAPELLHNLQRVVESCEQDIIQNARELQQAEDEVVVLERDLDDTRRQLQKIEQVAGVVRRVAGAVRLLDRGELTHEEAYLALVGLKEQYPLEYEMFYLGSVAGGVLEPLLRSELTGWEPLVDPELPAPALLKWRPLLADRAYHHLLLNLMLPPVEEAALSWNPREPEPMVQLIEACAPVCPEWMLKDWVEKAVVPRVLAAVRDWDPTGDTLPLHTWVLPWHGIASTSLDATVYPLIRARLSTALAPWHPADGSARPLLAAWRNAWGGALVALLHRHIVPKLEACLLAANMDVAAGGGSEVALAWGWCGEWEALVGAVTLGAVAGRALLPRWLGALAGWLNTVPPHAAVLDTYTQFKKLFSEEVQREPAVRDSFRKALDMMNRSADMELDPDVPVPPPAPKITYTEPKDTARICEVLASKKSFSELLESKCEERGVTFVPLAGKSREGRPVFKIGASMQCYVIRNVIMYSKDSGRTFLPISMEKLLSMAEDD